VPPAIGKDLARRVMTAFRNATKLIEAMPLGRPEHPDMPGARYAMFDSFPYLAFYTVKDDDIVVVAIEYATRDYLGRIASRLHGTE
jgi:plasmid stabilization system protein ParE